MLDFKNVKLPALGNTKSDEKYEKMLKDMLVDGETLYDSFRSPRYAAVFTNLRIVIVDYEGVTGKMKDYTSIPYTSITTFSVTTAGFMDFNSELDITVRSKGDLRIPFTSGVDITLVGKIIASHVLVIGANLNG